MTLYLSGVLCPLSACPTLPFNDIFALLSFSGAPAGLLPFVSLLYICASVDGSFRNRNGGRR